VAGHRVRHGRCEEDEISCQCRELKHYSPSFASAASLLYQLRCPSLEFDVMLHIFERTKKKWEIMDQNKYSPDKIELWTSLIHSRIAAYLPSTFVVLNAVPYFTRIFLLNVSYF